MTLTSVSVGHGSYVDYAYRYTFVSLFSRVQESTVRSTDNCQFQLGIYREIKGIITIDSGGLLMLLLDVENPGNTMPCPNCQCPFHELHSDDSLFSSAELNCLVTDAVKQVNFGAGDVVFAQGQPSVSLYSVNSGLVKITCHSADGREQIVGLSIPGKLLVGLQSIHGDCYEYSAVAASDVSACKISHRTLLTAVKSRPEIAMRLVAAVNAQLAHSRSLMLVMGHKCAAAKIASFLLLVAPKEHNGNGRFTLPFSRNDMAGILGLSEETVCRQMAEMKRKGVIYAPRGRMEIQDWDRLHAIAEGPAPKLEKNAGKMVGPRGLEPRTKRLRVSCSTN